MATSTAFEWLCERIEAETALDRLEARGTVRIALKEDGLEAVSVTPGQIAVVLSRVLPSNSPVAAWRTPTRCAGGSPRASTTSPTPRAGRTARKPSSHAWAPEWILRSGDGRLLVGKGTIKSAFRRHRA